MSKGNHYDQKGGGGEKNEKEERNVFVFSDDEIEVKGNKRHNKRNVKSTIAM